MPAPEALTRVHAPGRAQLREFPRQTSAPRPAKSSSRSVACLCCDPRLRPARRQSAARRLGVAWTRSGRWTDANHALPAALGIELLHAYHPGARRRHDRDELRRGGPLCTSCWASRPRSMSAANCFRLESTSAARSRSSWQPLASLGTRSGALHAVSPERPPRRCPSARTARWPRSRWARRWTSLRRSGCPLGPRGHPGDRAPQDGSYNLRDAALASARTSPAPALPCSKRSSR